MNLEKTICQVLEDSGSPMEISEIARYIDGNITPVQRQDVEQCIAASFRLNITNSGKCVLSDWLVKPGANFTGDENRVIVGNYFRLREQNLDAQQSNTPFSDNVALLEEFLVDNRHFPFSSATDENEHRLYLWWNSVSRRARLPLEQRKEVTRISRKYSKYKIGKRRFEWNFRIEEYWQYAESHNAFPPYSSYLYSWYYNNKVDYKHNRMDKEQAEKFKELYEYVEEVRRLIAQSRRLNTHPIASQCKTTIDALVVNLF